MAKGTQPGRSWRVVKTRRRAGSPAKIDVFEERAIGDEEGGARVFELKADFALAVSGVQQRRDCSGESGGVIGDGELPGVGEEDGDDFAGVEAGGDEAVGQRLDELSIFCIGEAAAAGSIDKGGFGGVAAAGIEDDIVEESAGGIGEELGASIGRL